MKAKILGSILVVTAICSLFIGYLDVCIVMGLMGTAVLFAKDEDIA